MAVESPTRFGELEVVRRIGAGGFGVVYLANDRRLGRKVALKLAHPGRGDLIREARAAARLAHPNVVTIYEIGDHDGSPYLVMEYVDGPTLRDRLEGERMPLADALRVARDIAAATAAAHKEGIIHADLTPSNVLLAADGRARVVDFGLARAGNALEITPLGEVTNPKHSIAAGTPTYMSPEQWRMERLGPPADIWALGAITHVLVTGEPPVDGTSEILRERVAGAAALELSPALAGVPQDLGALVRRCLSKDPATRPSAADVASELDKFLMKIDGALQPFRPHAVHCVDREGVMSEIAALVCANRIVTITGAAGAGKSCAMHGAAAALRADGWRVAIARPTLAAIANALRMIASGAAVATLDADEKPEEDEVTRWASPERFAADLGDAATAAGKLVLVIDPLDTADDATMRALAAAVADEGGAHLVFVARTAPAGVGDTGRVFALPPATHDELVTMLERPVTDAGYRFEDGLVDAIANDALRTPTPALRAQLAGAALWDRRDRDARTLTRAAYAAFRKPPRRRSRWLLRAAAVLVVAVAGGLVAYRMRSKPARGVATGPQCFPAFFPKQEIVPWYNDTKLQDAINAVSSDGRSIITHRRDCRTPDLPVGWSTMLVENLDGTPKTIVLSELLDGLWPNDGQVTMTGDALTVISSVPDGTHLLAWSRSKRGASDFKPRDPAELAAFTVTSPSKIVHPVISQDGLELFVTIRETKIPHPMPAQPWWIYHSTRSRVGEPFPPLEPMSIAMMNIDVVTGISSDRLSLFFQSGYAVGIFTRARIGEPFTNPNFPIGNPTVPGFRTRPIGDCNQLVGTCTSGCVNEETCLFSR